MTAADEPRAAFHIDEVRDCDGAVLACLLVNSRCDDNCDPGNCEVAHAERFGLLP
jgi:hypothetical protein